MTNRDDSPSYLDENLTEEEKESGRTRIPMPEEEGEGKGKEARPMNPERPMNPDRPDEFGDGDRRS